jgi:hypothetical protein
MRSRTLISVTRVRNELRQIPGCLSSEVPDGTPPEFTDPGPFGARSIWGDEEMGADVVQEAYTEGSDQDMDDLFEILSDFDLADATAALDGEFGTQLRRAVRVRHIDALAWYVPFHYPKVQWGIYIPTSSIVFLAITVFLPLKNCSLEQALRLAVRALHRHEIFHFAMDYFAAQIEVLTREPCFLPSRALKAPHGYNLLEEGVANAHMLRSLRNLPNRIKVKGNAGVLGDFVLAGPPGYSDGINLKSNVRYHSAVTDLVTGYLSCSKGLSGHPFRGLTGYDLLPAFPNFPWRHCPIHIIADGARLGAPPDIIRWIHQISQIAETSEFKKALGRLGSDVGKKWDKAKDRLATNTGAKGLHFRKWDKDTTYRAVYSVNVDRSYRAHIGLASDGWHAFKIGGHKMMGHG